METIMVLLAPVAALLVLLPSPGRHGRGDE